jgi:hypothetical protein
MAWMVGLSFAGGIVIGAIRMHPAWAGYRTQIPLWISPSDPSGGAAVGNLGAVRNVAGNGYTQCSLSADPTAVSGRCNASDGAGRNVSCTTSSAALISAIKMLGSESYVSFQFDGSSRCTQITVATGSLLEPKSQ